MYFRQCLEFIALVDLTLKSRPSFWMLLYLKKYILARALLPTKSFLLKSNSQCSVSSQSEGRTASPDLRACMTLRDVGDTLYRPEKGKKWKTRKCFRMKIDVQRSGRKLPSGILIQRGKNYPWVVREHWSTWFSKESRLHITSWSNEEFERFFFALN